MTTGLKCLAIPTFPFLHLLVNGFCVIIQSFGVILVTYNSCKFHAFRKVSFYLQCLFVILYFFNKK